jgi:hypothetical protein
MRRPKTIVQGMVLGLFLPFLSVAAFAQDCSRWYTDFRESVVSISVEKVRKETGVVTRASGTGFIVSEEGHIVTAHHVVADDPNTDEIKVFGAIGSLARPKTELLILSTDKTKDIALLAFLDNSQSYRPMPLGNPFVTIAGTQLCSLSFSSELNEDYHTTTGTLSKKTGEDKTAGIKNLWTTQMPSNFGESGAPVIDLTNGGVVAIKYGGRNPGAIQNVNYVIPLNLAKAMLEEYCNVKIPTPPDSGTTPAIEAVLRSIQVFFVLPNGDDRDFDTAIEIQITKGNLVLASHGNLAGGIKFADPGKYGAYSLTVSSTSVTKAVYKNSTVTMRITPNGNDRWITGLILEATFSDGQVHRSEFSPTVLDQDNRIASFQNP